MTKKPKTTKDAVIKRIDSMFRALNYFIEEYREAAINDSWKGGGDPADIELLELRLKLTRTELNAHILKMRREFD